MNETNAIEECIGYAAYSTSETARDMARRAIPEINALQAEKDKYLAALKEIDALLTGSLPVTAEVKEIIREATE